MNVFTNNEINYGSIKSIEIQRFTWRYNGDIQEINSYVQSSVAFFYYNFLLTINIIHHWVSFIIIINYIEIHWDVFIYKQTHWNTTLRSCKNKSNTKTIEIRLCYTRWRLIAESFGLLDQFRYQNCSPRLIIDNWCFLTIKHESRDKEIPIITPEVFKWS